MTARTQTKEYGHFLVKWGGNGKETEYLVVQRSKILAEGRIKVGETYNTIWGDSSADADDAQVIATGEWLEMRKLLKVHQDGQTSPDKSSEESSPDSPQPSKRKSSEESLPDSPQPTKRQRLTSKTTYKVTKPEAKVISWADGITDSAAIDPYVFRSLTPSPVLPHQYQPPTPTSTHSPISTQDAATRTTSTIPGNNLMSTIAEIKQPQQQIYHTGAGN